MINPTLQKTSRPCRSYYFGPGPASLPDEVLQEIQEEMFNWRNSKLSILEVGHRSEIFTEAITELIKEFRCVLAIPNDYHIIFMGCPTRMHFNLIPMNFIGDKEAAGFWLTGHWSRLAFDEANNNKRAYQIPLATNAYEWQLQDNTAYVYATINETLEGVRFDPFLKTCKYPVVADLTSCLATEVVHIENYAFIVAGAQKNLGCAGLSVAIVSPEFLDKIKSHNNIPSYLNYRTYADANSLCVTPPTFNCDVMLKVINWIKKQGGVATLAQENQRKSQTLYQAIDNSNLYYNQVPIEARSKVNVTFNLKDKSKEPDFFAAAKNAGLIGLEGHRTLGGVRASLYNAMPYQGVLELIDFMMEFEKHG